MSRLVIFVLPLAVVSLAAAPLPKARDKAAPFLMTTEGDKKVSECHADGSVHELIEVVSKVEKKGDTLRVTISRQSDGRSSDDVTFEASAEGVFLVAVAGKERAARRPDLRLPAKEGDTWSWEEEEPGVAPAKHTKTVAKWEEVEVPAGKFQALRIEARLDSPGSPTRTGTYWFAPGMGVIKSVLNTSPGVQTTVLTSFKPGK